jgi:hypothetical protein
MASKWYLQPRAWLEAFALVNLGFLAPDIYLAHSTNLFREPAEYVPFYFSLAAPVLLLAAAVAAWRESERGWRLLGHVVGWGAVVVGVAGLILHLGSRFFSEATLESLVYTAPFAAPLSYTGLGLLLIMNRMVDPESAEWPLWVLLLTLGGFVGNFIFTLADHAQNAFFHKTEWIPVAASAFAIGFLLLPFVVRLNRSYVAVCAAVMLVQVAVGLLGFYYHTAANLRGPSASWFDNFVYGAPAMAPLLFPNLALLAFIGLWRLRESLSPSRAPAPALSPGDTSR